LDFGSGTGNITGKLLDIGFEVTAVDISREMSKILKLKFAKEGAIERLHILNLNIDNVEMEGDFDFVACFSVLHHLPDYIGTIKKLARLVKKSGILYFDNESAPIFEKRTCILNRAVNYVHYLTKDLLNRLYFWSVRIPKLDYSKADVRGRLGDLDYARIIDVLREDGFSIVEFYSYCHYDSWFRLPTALFRRALAQPDTTLLIAKKTR
jgi:SAM-dependent methyltransferase